MQDLAKLHAITAGKCLILEDAPSGIEAAKAAQMKVFAIPICKYLKN